MRNIGKSKLQYLLYALLLLALTGCGANSTFDTAGTNGSGSIAAKLAWGAGKSTDKTVASAPGGVTSIQVTVTGTGVDGKAIPVVRGTIDAGTNQGTVGGIYPGKVTLAVKALNGSAVSFEGYAIGVVVNAGATTTIADPIVMSPPLEKAQDTGCIQCHETTQDVTGQNLVADYKQSGHYTNLAWNSNAIFGITGTGCAGCHGPSHNDAAPSASGRCYDCHGAVLNPAHFNSGTADGADAMYVSSRYNNNCSACHEPHNPLDGTGKAERQAWAESGHGNTKGAAWSHYDFASRDVCNRCHTPDGFKKALASNFTNTTKVAATATTGHEVLACDACHSDNNFSLRTVAAFSAPYNNGASPKQLPDAGESNLCNTCHTGLESGDSIASVTNFSNASFKNSHYMAAAGLMYMSTGFTNFTTASATIGTSTYAKTLTADNATVPTYGISGGVSSTHRKLGTTLIRGDSHNTSFFVAGNADKNGPCVTCHLNTNLNSGIKRAATGHTLEIDENTYNQLCVNCHSSENTVPLTAANFKAVFIEPQSEAFQSTLKLAINLLLTKYNIKYDSTLYPYFYDLNISATAPVKDWTRGTGNQAFGKKMMGAAFNINVLYRDPAAYAHARSYSRRLLYDSIDFLDDGVINLSVGATAVASGLLDGSGNPLFAKGAQAYNSTGTAITTIYSGTSEAMLYLVGWSRSSGAWNTPERP